MSKWPESAVAVALILLIGAVSVTGIARYEPADFLKIWAALTSLVGIITGAIVTYFFTRSSIDQAERKVVETERKLEDERSRSRELEIVTRARHLADVRSQDSRVEDEIDGWAQPREQRRPN